MQKISNALTQFFLPYISPFTQRDGIKVFGSFFLILPSGAGVLVPTQFPYSNQAAIFFCSNDLDPHLRIE
jgi:hypothetical protein